MAQFHTVLTAFLGGLLCAGLAHSQVLNATLLGTVKDASGAAVPNAGVTITESDTGLAYTRTSDESGNYTFPGIPSGQYSVTVTMTGFRQETRKGVAVLVNSSTRLDVELQPGSVTESIEVRALPPILQTDRTDTGRSIESVLVADLPLDGNRNFQTLLELAPGTSPSTFEHSQFVNAASSLQNRVMGQSRQSNSYQIDGVDDNSRSRNLQILVPPAEAIQSVDISTSNHDSELGVSTGAVMNAILKSGTNNYHGGAYWYLQNSHFNARSFFNPSVGHLAYNYAGANMGGPIKKNKYFFFADFLRRTTHEANTNLVTVPSMAFRSGDLSAAPTTVYNPFSGNADGTARAPFPGNRIPASLINSVSAKILTLLPAPNQPFVERNPSNNYFAELPFQKTTDSFDVKVDGALTDDDRASVRFSYARPTIYQAPIFGLAGGPAQSAFQGSGLQRTYSSGISYNRILSPKLITEVRAGVAYYINTAQQSDYGTDAATAIGVPGVNISQFTSGMVGISISGLSSPMVGYSASLPWVRAGTNISLVNVWTAISGSHTVKFGSELRRLRDNILQGQTFSPRGVISFGVNQTALPGSATGVANSFASFLLDLPNSVGRDLDTYFPGLRIWQLAAFASDTWQIAPKLTVNLGLRWEFYPPATPPSPGAFSNYDPASDTLVIAGIGGNPMNLGVQTRYRYFAPRTGISYRLNNRTVLRAGFGISYTSPCTNSGCQAWNYPVRSNNSYQPAADNPYGAAVLPDGRPATFQAGFPAPNPTVIPPNGIIKADRTSVYTVTPQDHKSPYVETWSAAVQQALPHRLTLDVAYVGSHGVHTFSATDLNAGRVIGAGAMGRPLYPRTTATTLYYQGFSSSYHALQAKFDRRISSGLLLTTSFTWSKAMNRQSGDDGGLLFYIDQGRNYARADFDRTLTFVQSYVYDFPFGKNRKWLLHGPAAAVFGGWRVSGILSARTGTPLTFTANAASLNAPSNTQTPNQIADIQILHGINIGNPWFSTASVAQPVGAVFGSMGRNVIDGPGMFRLNASLFRKLSLTERFKLDIRAEAFNLTNTPQFANPNTSLTSTLFGTITNTVSTGTGVNSTGGGRAIQIGLRATF